MKTAATQVSPGFVDQHRLKTHWSTGSVDIYRGNYSSNVHSQGHGAWANADEEEENLDADGGVPVGEPSIADSVKPNGPRLERQATRTLLLLNLGEGITHGDIVGAIRGGTVLDVFIRSAERTASVSFVYAADARAFFDHVRKHDLYIKNKRVRLLSLHGTLEQPTDPAESSSISGGATASLLFPATLHPPSHMVLRAT